MEVHERLATLEANDKNIFHQLDEVKKEVADIHKLAASVEVIATQTFEINKKVDGIGERLDIVERKPIKDFWFYKRTVVACIVTGTITTILGAMLSFVLK